MKDYDAIQKSHYDKVAKADLDSPQSTMPDLIVRKIESDSILRTIRKWCLENNKDETKIRILDAGCGNGTTLDFLIKNLNNPNVIGIEYNKELMKIANSRKIAKVEWGDLVNRSSLPSAKFDVVITQRVIINIQNEQDQKTAIENIAELLEDGGLYIAIEAFKSGLDHMNLARNEFNLESVSMPYHNKFLEDGFFDQFENLSKILLEVDEGFLSTHYYLSYVLYPALAKVSGAEFNRNSIFVSIFDEVLPNKGVFGSNRFLTFTKGSVKGDK